MSASLGRLLIALASCLWAATGLPAAAQDARGSEVHVFWRVGCPYCEEALGYLDRLKQELPDLATEYLEVSGSDGNRALFIAVCKELDIDQPAVPAIVVGSRAFVGYLDDATTGAAIRQAILECRDQGCRNAVAQVADAMRADGAAAAPTDAKTKATTHLPSVPKVVSLPFIGAVTTDTLSLPMLTIVLGAADGFNPCAMWVLVFLIGLLVGMKNHRRMWILGGAFLFTSAAVYFVFMAAWLNVLLLLGTLLWIRVAVGLFALGGGLFYLREFVLSGDAVCKVASPERRRQIMDGLRNAVRQQSFPLALGGIVALAAAVNLIELLCSAGIPAIYSQVLAMNNLAAWQYYLYLLLYVAVFLLDDLVVFATSIVTLQAAGLTAKYSRFSHLIGGVVLCGIGVLLLLRPEWLTFG